MHEQVVRGGGVIIFVARTVVRLAIPALIAAGLAGASGCGAGTPLTLDASQPDPALRDLKTFLEWAKASGQATERNAAGPMLQNAYMFADYSLNAGQIQYLWGTKLAEGPEAAGTVIAFQTAAATDGGWVLFQDGSLKRISAAEFAAAPKAEP